MSRMDNPVNIAAGNGKIFIMTVTPVPGGNQIKQWNGTSFVRITGGLLDIQVDAGGRLWGANDEHKIFNYRP